MTSLTARWCAHLELGEGRGGGGLAYMHQYKVREEVACAGVCCISVPLLSGSLPQCYCTASGATAQLKEVETGSTCICQGGSATLVRTCYCSVPMRHSGCEQLGQNATCLHGFADLPDVFEMCRIGYLEQEPQLDAGDTVAENIAPAVQHIK